MSEISTNTTVESPSIQPSAGSVNKTATSTDPTAQQFPRGETQPPKLEPEGAVAKFVRHRTMSVREAVLSTVAASEGLNAFKGDTGKLQAWFNQMLRVKALPKAEAADSAVEMTSNSNLSKLRKIAEHESILTHPDIAALLPSGGYTTLYECGLLYETFKKRNPENALLLLLTKLEESDGPLTREWLKKQREIIQPPKPKKDKARPKSAPVEESAQAVSGEVGTAVSRTIASDIEDDVRATSTNEAEDEALERDAAHEEYGADEAAAADETTEDGGDESKCEDDDVELELSDVDDNESDPIKIVVINLPEGGFSKSDLIEMGSVAEEIDDDALLFVHGKLVDLITNVIEPGQFGMERCERVLLLKETTARDVTDNMSLAVFARGLATVEGIVPDWETDTDPAVAADHLAGDIVGRKVLLFGRTDEAGWEIAGG